MTFDFEMLCSKTKEASFVALEEWGDEPQDGVDIVDVVLAKALTATLPKVDDIDGDWIMQMMWQVPDLMVDTEYSEDMDVNAATLKAVQFRIGSIIRDDVMERVSELGLDSHGPRV